MSDSSEHTELVEEVWRSYLTTGEIPDVTAPFGLTYRRFKHIMRLLPGDPRCTLCYVPFHGIAASFARTMMRRTRSPMNPNLCNICELFAEQHKGGAEVELSMLFADIRGSTTLAQEMSPAEYSQRINRFYQVTTDLMIESYGLIEKLIGDEVVGLYVPGIAGPHHTRVALETAQAMLQATGHGSDEGPWVPIGAGVHTGVAFVGSVGSNDGMSTITALGDAVNITARLASAAGPGELLVSAAASREAQMDDAELEYRELSLKGVNEPMSVYVVQANTSMVFKDT